MPMQNGLHDERGNLTAQTRTPTRNIYLTPAYKPHTRMSMDAHGAQCYRTEHSEQ